MDLGVVIGLAGWVVGWWLLWRLPVLGETATVDGRPGGHRSAVLADLAVVIPARDEERSLPSLLDSLVAQDVTPRQIVVVDDGSVDATARIAAARPGVTLLTGRPLPAGWTGKTWACAQGAAHADAARLLFLDADVTLAPGAVGALLAELERRGGLVSVQPHHRMEHAYERISAVFNVVAVMGVGMASPGRAARARGAFGPCLLLDRRDYERLGGHEAVRGSVVEDVALARRAAEVGLPVHAFGGGRAMGFRMYPSGLRQLLDGWTKNFATGAAAVGVGRSALIALWVTAVLTPPLLALDASRAGSAGALAVAAGLYLLDVVQFRVLARRVGDFGIVTALAAPLLAAVFVAVFVRSLWRTLVRRRVVWRGRDVPIGPVAGAPPGGEAR